MSSRAIRLALSERLLTLPHSPLPLMIWENDNPDREAEVQLWAQMIPSRPRRILIGSGDPTEYTGEMQVTVVLRTGIGAPSAEVLAQAITGHFPRDLLLPVSSPILRITDTPYLAPAYDSTPWWMLPVCIPYMSHF